MMSCSGGAEGPAASPSMAGRVHRKGPGGHGDGILPVPAVRVPPALASSCCRAVRKRENRRLAIHRNAVRSIEAVNSNAGYPTPFVERPEDLDPFGRGVWDRTTSLHAANAPPDVATTQEAAAHCSELLGTWASGYDLDPSPVRPYTPELVSWPDLGSKPAALASRLPGELRNLLEGRAGRFVRREADALKELSQDGTTVYGVLGSTGTVQRTPALWPKVSSAAYFGFRARSGSAKHASFL